MPLTIRPPGGNPVSVPEALTQAQDPAAIASFLAERGVDVQRDTIPVDQAAVRAIAAAQEQRRQEVLQSIGNRGLGQTIGTNAMEVIRSLPAPLPIAEAAGAAASKVGFSPNTAASLVDIARIVTPDYREGLGAAVRSTVTGLEPIAALATPIIAAGWASGLTNGIPLIDWGAAMRKSDAVRQVLQGIRSGMQPDVLPDQTLSQALAEPSIAEKAIALTNMGARGFLENIPTTVASVVMPQSALGWLAPSFAAETGDILGTALDEERYGPRALAAAAGGGAINALLEGVTLRPLRKMLGIDTPSAANLAKQAIRDTPSLLRSITEAMKTQPLEIPQEMLQEIVAIGSEIAGGGQIPSLADALDRIGTAGVMAAGGGAGQTVIGATAKHLDNLRQYDQQQRADRVIQFLEAQRRQQAANTPPILPPVPTQPADIGAQPPVIGTELQERAMKAFRSGDQAAMSDAIGQMLDQAEAANPPPTAPTPAAPLPAVATPSTAGTPQSSPESMKVLAEQVKLALKKSTKKSPGRMVVLIAPNTPPENIPSIPVYSKANPNGLVRVEAGRHGTLWINPKKLPPAKALGIVKNLQGDTDMLPAEWFGMAPTPPNPVSSVAVTTSTPEARNVTVQVPAATPAGIPDAAEAQRQAAGPNAVVEVKPAAQVAAERAEDAATSGGSNAVQKQGTSKVGVRQQKALGQGVGGQNQVTQAPAGAGAQAQPQGAAQPAAAQVASPWTSAAGSTAAAKATIQPAPKATEAASTTPLEWARQQQAASKTKATTKKSKVRVVKAKKTISPPAAQAEAAGVVAPAPTKTKPPKGGVAREEGQGRQDQEEGPQVAQTEQPAAATEAKVEAAAAELTKEDKLKAEVAELTKDLKAALSDILGPPGTRQMAIMPPINKKVATTGLKLIGKLLELGVVKFANVLSRLQETFGQQVPDISRWAKGLYIQARKLADPKLRKQMDSDEVIDRHLKKLGIPTEDPTPKTIRISKKKAAARGGAAAETEKSVRLNRPAKPAATRATKPPEPTETPTQPTPEKETKPATAAPTETVRGLKSSVLSDWKFGELQRLQKAGFVGKGAGAINTNQQFTDAMQAHIGDDSSPMSVSGAARRGNPINAALLKILLQRGDKPDQYISVPLQPPPGYVLNQQDNHYYLQTDDPKLVESYEVPVEEGRRDVAKAAEGAWMRELEWDPLARIAPVPPPISGKLTGEQIIQALQKKVEALKRQQDAMEVGSAGKPSVIESSRAMANAVIAKTREARGAIAGSATSRKVGKLELALHPMRLGSSILEGLQREIEQLEGVIRSIRLRDQRDMSNESQFIYRDIPILQSYPDAVEVEFRSNLGGNKVVVRVIDSPSNRRLADELADGDERPAPRVLADEIARLGIGTVQGGNEVVLTRDGARRIFSRGFMETLQHHRGQLNELAHTMRSAYEASSQATAISMMPSGDQPRGLMAQIPEDATDADGLEKVDNRIAQWIQNLKDQRITPDMKAAGVTNPLVALGYLNVVQQVVRRRRAELEVGRLLNNPSFATWAQRVGLASGLTFYKSGGIAPGQDSASLRRFLDFATRAYLARYDDEEALKRSQDRPSVMPSESELDQYADAIEKGSVAGLTPDQKLWGQWRQIRRRWDPVDRVATEIDADRRQTIRDLNNLYARYTNIATAPKSIRDLRDQLSQRLDALGARMRAEVYDIRANRSGLARFQEAANELTEAKRSIQAQQDATNLLRRLRQYPEDEHSQFLDYEIARAEDDLEAARSGVSEGEAVNRPNELAESAAQVTSPTGQPREVPGVESADRAGRIATYQARLDRTRAAVTAARSALMQSIQGGKSDIDHAIELLKPTLDQGMALNKAEAKVQIRRKAYRAETQEAAMDRLDAIEHDLGQRGYFGEPPNQMIGRDRAILAGMPLEDQMVAHFYRANTISEFFRAASSHQRAIENIDKQIAAADELIAGSVFESDDYRYLTAERDRLQARKAELEKALQDDLRDANAQEIRETEQEISDLEAKLQQLQSAKRPAAASIEAINKKIKVARDRLSVIRVGRNTINPRSGRAAIRGFATRSARAIMRRMPLPVEERLRYLNAMAMGFMAANNVIAASRGRRGGTRLNKSQAAKDLMGALEEEVIRGQPWLQPGAARIALRMMVEGAVDDYRHEATLPRNKDQDAEQDELPSDESNKPAVHMAALGHPEGMTLRQMVDSMKANTPEGIRLTALLTRHVTPAKAKAINSNYSRKMVVLQVPSSGVSYLLPLSYRSGEGGSDRTIRIMSPFRGFTFQGEGKNRQRQGFRAGSYRDIETLADLSSLRGARVVGVITLSPNHSISQPDPIVLDNREAHELLINVANEVADIDGSGGGDALTNDAAAVSRGSAMQDRLQAELQKGSGYTDEDQDRIQNELEAYAQDDDLNAAVNGLLNPNRETDATLAADSAADLFVWLADRLHRHGNDVQAFLESMGEDGSMDAGLYGTVLRLYDEIRDAGSTEVATGASRDPGVSSVKAALPGRTVDREDAFFADFINALQEATNDLIAEQQSGEVSPAGPEAADTHFAEAIAKRLGLKPSGNIIQGIRARAGAPVPILKPGSARNRTVRLNRRQSRAVAPPPPPILKASEVEELKAAMEARLDRHGQIAWAPGLARRVQVEMEQEFEKALADNNVEPIAWKQQVSTGSRATILSPMQAAVFLAAFRNSNARKPFIPTWWSVQVDRNGRVTITDYSRGETGREFRRYTHKPMVEIPVRAQLAIQGRIRSGGETAAEKAWNEKMALRDAALAESSARARYAANEWAQQAYRVKTMRDHWIEHPVTAPRTGDEREQEMVARRQRDEEIAQQAVVEQQQAEQTAQERTQQNREARAAGEEQLNAAERDFLAWRQRYRSDPNVRKSVRFNRLRDPSVAGTGMSVQEVELAVTDILNMEALPPGIEVLDVGDPELSGVFRDGKIQLIARNLKDAGHVRLVLLEELLHAARNNPEVRRQWDAILEDARKASPELRAAMEKLYGDNAEEVAEELGVTTAIDIADRTPDSLLERFFQKVQDVLYRMPLIGRIARAIGMPMRGAEARTLLAEALANAANLRAKPISVTVLAGNPETAKAPAPEAPEMTEAEWNARQELAYQSNARYSRLGKQQIRNLPAYNRHMERMGLGRNADENARRVRQFQQEVAQQANMIPERHSQQLNQWSAIDSAALDAANSDDERLDFMGRKRASRGLRFVLELSQLPKNNITERLRQIADRYDAMPDRTPDQMAAKLQMLDEIRTIGEGIVGWHLFLHNVLLKARQQVIEYERKLRSEQEALAERLGRGTVEELTQEVEALRDDLHEWLDQEPRSQLQSLGTAEARTLNAASVVIDSIFRHRGATSDLVAMLNALATNPAYADDVQNILDQDVTPAQMRDQLIDGPIARLLADNQELAQSLGIQALMTPRADMGNVAPIRRFLSLPSVLRVAQAGHSQQAAAQEAVNRVLRVRPQLGAGTQLADINRLLDIVLRQSRELGRERGAIVANNRRIRHANVAMLAAAHKIQFLQDLLRDPQYREQVEVAADRGDSRYPDLLVEGHGRSRGSISPEEAAARRAERLPAIEGGLDRVQANEIALKMPPGPDGSGETRRFTWNYQREHDQQTRRQVIAAAEEIADWIRRVDQGEITDDPIRVRQYRNFVLPRLGQIANAMWSLDDGNTGGSWLTGLYVSPKTINSLTAGLGSIFEPLVHDLGGQAGRQLRGVMDSLNRIHAATRILVDELPAMLAKPWEAVAKQEGIGQDEFQKAQHYLQTITNTIAKQGQTNRDAGYGVGDRIFDAETGRSHIVTAADMELAKVLKRFNDKIRRVVEANEGPVTPAERHDTTLAEVEKAESGKLERMTRASISPGPFTTARWISRDARDLLHQWMEMVPYARTEGNAPGPRNWQAGREERYRRFFATDPGTGLPVDRHAWSQLVLGHVMETNPEYRLRTRSKLARAYDRVAAAMRDPNGPDIVNTEMLLERIVDAMGSVLEDQRPHDERLAEARTLLFNEVETAMRNLEERFGSELSGDIITLRTVRDQFNTARGDLVGPGNLYDHLPATQQQQHQLVEGATSNQSDKVAQALSGVRQALSREIARHRRDEEVGREGPYSEAAKRAGRVRHTVEELEKYERVFGYLENYLLDSQRQSPERNSMAARLIASWLGMSVSLVLSPFFSPAAVAKDLVSTSSWQTPMMLYGMGRGLLATALSPVSGLARVTADLARMVADTKIGRGLGKVLPFLTGMAQQHQRMRNEQIAMALADQRFGNDIIYNKSLTSLSPEVEQMGRQWGWMGRKIARANRKVQQWTRNVMSHRAYIEDPLVRNVMMQTEGLMRQIRRSFRRSMMRREAAGTYNSNLSSPNSKVGPDDIFRGVGWFGRDRNQAFRSIQELFHSTMGMDRALYRWFEETRGMSEAEAVKRPFDPETNTQVMRTAVTILIPTRPSYTSLPQSRYARGPTGFVGKMLTFLKAQPSAMKTQLARTLGRSSRASMLGRNLGVSMAVSGAMLAVLIGLLMSAEGPDELRALMANTGRPTVGLKDVLNDPALVGKFGSDAALRLGLLPDLVMYGMGASMNHYDPMDLANHMFGLSILEDQVRATMTGLQRGPAAGFEVLARRRVPLVNQLWTAMGGEADAQALYRAYRRLMPELAKENVGYRSGLFDVQSEESALARKSANALIAGNRGEAASRKRQLVQLLRKRGVRGEEADRRASQRIAAQMPLRRAFGSTPTDREISLLRSRMGARERNLMRREINITSLRPY